MFILMNILETARFDWKKVSVAIFLFLMLSLFTYLWRFYARLKRTREFVIEFENGVLNDYSKPFNRATSLNISSIKTITFWRETKGITQFKIVTKKENERQKGLMNQLKGNHIYISDYIVDSEGLFSLVESLQNNADNIEFTKPQN